MKFFALMSVLAVSLVAQSSFAKSGAADAEKAFAASTVVQTAIKALKTKGFTKEENVESITVSGGCGFAGCDSTLLVVQRLSTEGSNTRTQSVIGLVSVPAVGSPTVKLAHLTTSK